MKARFTTTLLGTVIEPESVPPVQSRVPPMVNVPRMVPPLSRKSENVQLGASTGPPEMMMVSEAAGMPYGNQLVTFYQEGGLIEFPV